MNFLDTNILLYSISDDPRERGKQGIATALLDRTDNALSVQVLQEFYAQATRPTRSNPLPHELAAGFIRTWLLRFPVQEITIAVLRTALDITAAHRLSYWDAAIVAAAQAVGCSTVLSEDMSDGQRIGGVVVSNPFRAR